MLRCREKPVCETVNLEFHLLTVAFSFAVNERCLSPRVSGKEQGKCSFCVSHVASPLRVQASPFPAKAERVPLRTPSSLAVPSQKTPHRAVRGAQAAARVPQAAPWGWAANRPRPGRAGPPRELRRVRGGAGEGAAVRERAGVTAAERRGGSGGGGGGGEAAERRHPALPEA